ncbi:MAG: YfhO family protein [Bryobacterales bacterium]|nr:YfhO family protein [Bryobacterales bacterium]
MAENHQSAASQPPARRLAPALILLVLFTLFFWRLTLTNQFNWLDSGDLAHQVLPWFQFQVGELQQGRLPLWDPHPYGGQPLIGQAQPGTAYPLNWLFFAMPTQHGWIRQNIANWYYVLIHWLAALFAWKLCRDQGCTEWGALLGGFLYGTGGYFGYVDWPQMLNGAMWAPLVLMYLLRAERGERVWASAAMGGLGLGVALLSGHHQVPIFIGLMSAAVWGFLVYRDRRLLAPAALFFTVAGLAGALQALPAWEYSRHAVRWVGTAEPVGHVTKVPYHVHRIYSFPPANLIGVAIPGLDPNMSFYEGVTALLLGAFGVLAGWRSRRPVRIAVCLLVGALIFAMGGHTVFHGMVYALLPVVEKARAPLMATVISHLCLALLAAHGLDALRQGEGIEERYGRRAVWVLGLFGAVVLLAFWTLYIAQGNAWKHDNRGSVAGMVALLAAAVLAAWQRGAVGVAGGSVALALLLALETGGGNVSTLPHNQERLEHLPALRRDTPWVKALRKLEPGARVQLDTEDLRHNFGDWNGVDVWHSYLASMTNNLYQLGIYEGRTRELFGVRYFAGVKGKPTAEWNEPVGDADSEAGFTIYRNRRALPRTWVVHDVVEARTADDYRRFIADASFDLRKRAFLRGPLPLAGVARCAGDGDDARLLRRVSDHVRLWAELDCGGLVVLSDTWYPGWQATVDGRPVPIVEVDGALRGVVATAGRHVIEMRYRPGSVYLGFALTLLGAAVAAAVCRRDRGLPGASRAV